MSPKETSEFIHWLNQELSSCGCIDNQLARQARIFYSVTSQARA